jgi:hypothetical protein
MSSRQDTWCSKELISVKLGDKRLNRRLAKVASDLLNNADEPIQLACGNWANAKAAYRLFDNDKLQEKKLLQAHQTETINRLEKSSEEIFLAIQDTTVLNYTHHPKKKGLGKINKNGGFEKPSMGFFLHNTLLMSENGLPLGLIDQTIYQHKTGEKIAHKQRPIIDKESYRWIESLQTTKALCKGKTVVTVGDRESDIYEMFLEADEIEAKVLIRASRDRILSKDQDHRTLWALLENTPLGGVETIHIPARHNQAERFITLEVRYNKVILKPPQRAPNAKGKILSPVTLQAVWLCEPTPPSGEERLEWMLLTNMPVKTLEDAVKMGKWYKLRWQIECYHRILKSGCKIEECRLETYERLKKYVRLKSIIAFRLFWLTLINRIHPEILSNQILEDHEWKALCCHVAKVQEAPQKPPTVREAVRMIAKIGGFLGRKSDGEPGMTYIWRGWEKLALISEFWLSLHPNLNCG